MKSFKHMMLNLNPFGRSKKRRTYKKKQNKRYTRRYRKKSMRGG